MTTPSPDTLRDEIVHAAQSAYARIPKHGKPAVRDNGVVEWTVFAAIVLTLPPSSSSPAGSTTQTIVPSLATGVKCLPATRLPPLGDTLHDSHAEVLARRGFVRWLLQEAASLSGSSAASDVLILSRGELGKEVKYALKEGVGVWLYVSALPCGDASTLHTAAHQPASDAATFSAQTETLSAVDGAARGRSGYANYGAIRTKPGRKDSPPSISFSCSDKISTWCALGLQGALLASFEPVYLHHVVVGGVQAPQDVPDEDEHRWCEDVRKEVERALYGRLEDVANDFPPPFALHRPSVHLTPLPFVFDKPPPPAESATANTSLVVVGGRKPEVLVNGCVQTSGWKAPGRTLVKDKLRSAVSRFEMMRAYVALQSLVDEGGDFEEDQETTYAALKARNRAYTEAKGVLRGPIGAPVGPEWRLPHDFQATVGSAPFSGWIVAGDRYASFTASGVVMEEKEGTDLT